MLLPVIYQAYVKLAVLIPAVNVPIIRFCQNNFAGSEAKEKFGLIRMPMCCL